MAPNGRMKGITDPATKKRIKGHLPFYSVDTEEEAEALIEAAIREGEFFRREDGALIEVTLAYDQTPAKLGEAGDNLAAIHARMKASA